MQIDARPFHPPIHPLCPKCGVSMDRVFGCEIDTSGCKDHDDIPEQKRVQRRNTPRNAHREEARFKKHIDERRKLYAEAGQTPNLRHTHSVPADLYHGKIRETGDKNYWNDPKNLSRHKSMKVD
jgi:hypothetical protein